MKIPTKQSCSEQSCSEIRSERALDQKVSQLFDSATHRKKRVRSGLLTVTAGLAIALAACGGSPTTSQSSTEESADTATEAVQTPADSNEAATLFVKDGVAIEGADPVAYFTEETYVPGSADYTYEWQGATWQFSSAENRDLFAENPEQYAPEYGGFCAWAVAAKNSLVPVDPNAWSVVDGKLYLNANQKVQENWLKDVPGFIAEANENWPELSQS